MKEHLPLFALRSRYQRLQGAFEHALPAADPRPLDFYPPLLRLTDSPPNPIGRKVLWALIGQLDPAVGETAGADRQ